MTENELATVTARLAASEEKFLGCLRMWIETSDALRDFLRDNHDSFQSQVHAFDKTEDLMAQQVKSMHALEAGMQAILRTVADNAAALNETNARVNAVLSKLEDHFGDSAGLKFEN